MNLYLNGKSIEGKCFSLQDIALTKHSVRYDFYKSPCSLQIGFRENKTGVYFPEERVLLGPIQLFQTALSPQDVKIQYLTSKSTDGDLINFFTQRHALNFNLMFLYNIQACDFKLNMAYDKEENVCEESLKCYQNFLSFYS